MKHLLLVIFLVAFTSCKDSTEKESTPEIAQNFSQGMKESISRGAGVYNNFCASCHLSTGSGIEGVFPPLQESDWLTKKREASIHAIKYGLSGSIKVNGVAYDNFMPMLGLNDKEIADVMNYINNSWGNHIKTEVTEEEVAAIKK